MQALLEYIRDNCTAIDREERFRDVLDEIYSFDSVGGPFAHMSPSRVLEEVDPVAFRCGVNDFMDGENTVEIFGDEYDADEAEQARERYADEVEIGEHDEDIAELRATDPDAQVSESVAAAREAFAAQVRTHDFNT